MRLIDADKLRGLAIPCQFRLGALTDLGVPLYQIDNAPTVERPQGEPVIKCKDCKYQIKEWREDRRMNEKGYWVYGCRHFGDLMGYWGFGGDDNEFCSDAEIKEAENDHP